MKCPRCDATMEERQREGVTIDVCAGCRGVWLDRGELEKLIARAQRELEEELRGYGEPGPPPSSDRGYRGKHDHERRQEHHYKKPHKRRWFDTFGDIFD